jgi:hypothetical protein
MPSKQKLSPLEAARLLRDLVEVMIPGDGEWPSAADVGCHGLIGIRLVELLGEAGFDGMIAALVECGAPFAGRTPDDREAIIARFEASDAKRFAKLRLALYTGYYEHPAVVAAVASLGMPYLARPVLGGYELPPFDPARDAPRQKRGFYVRTEDVKRVDLSGLPHLAGR